MSEPIGYDRKSLGVKPVFRQIFIKRMMVSWIITAAIVASGLLYVSNLYKSFCKAYLEGTFKAADVEIIEKLTAGDVSGRCIITDPSEGSEDAELWYWYTDGENYDKKTEKVKEILGEIGERIHQRNVPWGEEIFSKRRIVDTTYSIFTITPPPFICQVHGCEPTMRETTENGLLFSMTRTKTIFLDSSEYAKKRANVFERRQLVSVKADVENAYFDKNYIIVYNNGSNIIAGKAITLASTDQNASSFYDSYDIIIGVSGSFVGRFPHLVFIYVFIGFSVATLIAYLSSRNTYWDRLMKYNNIIAMENTVSLTALSAHVKENTDVAEVCRKILEEMKEPLRKAGMERYFSAEMKPLVAVDRDRLKQALIMILQHAMNYSAAGSTIKVIVSPGEISVEKCIVKREFSDRLIIGRSGDIYHYENSIDLLTAKNILNISGMDMATGLFEDLVKIKCMFKTKDFNLEKGSEE